MTLDGGRHHDPFGTRHPPAALERVTAGAGSVPAGLKRDIPDADVRFVDTGHFALETHAEEIAAAIGEFLTR
jgi:hypothetical protein